MPLEFTFTCSLPSGLHARPAAQLADRANVFASGCFLINLRNGMDANLKSPLAIIAANVKAGDACSVRVTGRDEELALAALRDFVEEDLPKADEPLIQSATDDKHGVVPRDIKQAGVSCYFGRAVQRGIERGKAVLVNRLAMPARLEPEAAGDPRREEQRIREALAKVQSHIRAMQAMPGTAAQKAVIKAQLSIAGDISLADKLAERIALGRSAGQAVVEAEKFFLDLFQQAESTYIHERALDLQDVLQQLLHEIYGPEFQGGIAELGGPSVAIAETLSPQQLLSLDRRWLRAVVLESASTTAHAVILAHSLGIPTLVGVKDALRQLVPGQEVVVDANRGFVVSGSNSAVARFYTHEIDMLQRRRHILARGIANPVTTIDGRKMEVAANVASAEELAPAFEQGADGIGLFRTEMLFMGRESSPTEEEQVAIYMEAARLAGGRSIIIRTLDTGGDKPVPQLSPPRESNPFLGYRGVRIYPDFRDLVRTQVRAILRASAFGRIQMMVPMVCTVEEVLWVKALIRQVQNELAAENIPFNPAMPLGVMIETPSAAFILNELCAELDFFSIGTNDLSQYFFAADRGNDRVAGLSRPRRPAFLRLLGQIVKQVQAAGKWIGMCGEMTADPGNLSLLVGLGLDEISVPASQVPELKQKLRRLSAQSCEELLSQATACVHVEDVDDLLRESHFAHGTQPLLTPELVVVDDESENKEAAIREMVEAFYLTGRTDDPQFVEEAVWSRETISSTGLGYGFAIPHCKTDAVLADSIGILKLKQPIAWGSLDDQPVQMVILLAVRESQANGRHLQILSQLARKLMDEDFRIRLLALQDAHAVVSHLSRELGVE
jgi:phosphoenolpyruvate-protein phosphotransferase